MASTKADATKKKICDICKWEFSSKKSLADHHIRHHFMRRCPNCLKSFQTTKTFIRHLRSHIDDQPYQCKICVKSFNRKIHLVSHRKQCKNPELACDQCPMKFGNCHALNLHKSAHKKGPYGCPICGAKFATVMDRVIHRKNHLRTCALCQVNFPTDDALINHILEVHRGRITPKPPASRYLANRHDSDSDEGSDSMEDSPSSSSEDTDSDEETEHCALEVDTAVEPVHCLKHKSKFICFMCLLLFRTSERLQVHMKNHKWFPCSRCPKFFAHVKALKRHKSNCIAADLHPVKEKALKLIPKSVNLPSSPKQAIKNQMTSFRLQNPDCEIKVKGAEVVHREKEINSTLITNQSSCPSFSIDLVSSQERLLELDEWDFPPLNFLNAVDMYWLTKFVKLTKTLDFHSLLKVAYIYGLIRNALRSDVPLSKEAVAHLLDVSSDLCNLLKNYQSLQHASSIHEDAGINNQAKGDKYGGGNSYCPRPTPKWQEPITNSLRKKKAAESAAGSRENLGSSSSTHGKEMVSPYEAISVEGDSESKEVCY